MNRTVVSLAVMTILVAAVMFAMSLPISRLAARAREKRLHQAGTTAHGGDSQVESTSGISGPKAGETAPEFKLSSPDGKMEAALSDFKGKKPVVLIFGSYTCPPFRESAGRIEEVYNKYKRNTQFFIVYIREAHPVGSLQSETNEKQGIKIEDPKTMDERREVAHSCIGRMKLSLPALVDGMDDATGRGYGAFPDRIYVVDKDGTIYYQGAPGPKGFHLDELDESLGKLLDRR